MLTPDFLFNRDPESHKGNYGHALLIAGSYGKMGAAVLAARACLRAGVGLLTVHVPRCGVNILQTAVPEAMLSIDDDERLFTSMPANIDRYDAIAVGPGLGTDERTQNVLLALLEASSQRPLVIDADALNILTLHPEAVHLAKGNILTPHVKEYARLFADAAPQSMADMHELVIVKKAHRTKVYAPNADVVENLTGNAGMATAGSGDVLTGIILGLLAQSAACRHRNLSEVVLLQDIAALAVHLHGSAGDIAASRLSQPSLIASDIIECLPATIQSMKR